MREERKSSGPGQNDANARSESRLLRLGGKVPVGMQSHELQVIARRSWRPTTDKRRLAFRNCLPSPGAGHAVLQVANALGAAHRLALQLPFFEVGALSDCLVSSTPE